MHTPSDAWARTNQWIAGLLRLAIGHNVAVLNEPMAACLPRMECSLREQKWNASDALRKTPFVARPALVINPHGLRPLNKIGKCAAWITASCPVDLPEVVLVGVTPVSEFPLSGLPSKQARSCELPCQRQFSVQRFRGIYLTAGYGYGGS